MKTLAILLLFLFSCNAGAVPLGNDPDKRKEHAPSKTKDGGSLCNKVVGIINPITNRSENYIFDSALYQFRVDTLPQIKFWRQIMKLHQDSSLLCFAHNRSVIRKISNNEWNIKSDSLKKYYRDSIRLAVKLDSTNRILLTAGKKFFYDFDKTYQNFHNGINCFVDNSVDPWYAQAILLIESPNKLQKSNAGAYGSFQLMKDVARMYGLKVNKQIDERSDFERSAYAASCLIKYICIPKVYKMLDSLGIKEVDEKELWFKLLVMHTYHAGAYNVQSALFTFMPKEGDMNLIYNLWHAQTNRFKSASQNYSQLILAAMLEMNERSKAYSAQPVLVKAKNKP
ncbi:MAG: hypothetical protein JWO32_2275 [Bacteroidetes bacterium]|nr:hypothetical protein [Bacteroidota bacterium]